MRRAAPPRPTLREVGGVPPEIAAGPMVGVWGDGLLAAATAYAAGRRQWEAEHNLDGRSSHALVPARRPVAGAQAVARLARLGIPVDLAALRARAQDRLD